MLSEWKYGLQYISHYTVENLRCRARHSAKNTLSEPNSAKQGVIECVHTIFELVLAPKFFAELFLVFYSQ